MNRVFYHGTDARISLMSDKERKTLRQDIFCALDYMWDLMRPYFQKYDKVIDHPPYIRFVERIKRFEGSVSKDMFNKLYESLTHEKGRRDGLASWQYQDNMIYLTTDLEKAISYAYRSFVFGELGETIWNMYQGMKALNLDSWNPGKNIQSTLDKIQRMAEEEHIPVVYLLTNLEQTNLLTELGKPVTDEVLEHHPHFRYEDESVYLNPRDLDKAIYLRPLANIGQFLKKYSQKKPLSYRLDCSD